MTGRSTKVPRPCACTTVRKTSRRLARVYDQALQPTALNVTQLALLRAVVREAGKPISQVAASLSMDRTSAYRALGTMEKRGWVVVRAGVHKRARAAELTQAGHEVLADAAPHWDSIQTEVVRRFGVRRWQRLVAELEELANVADSVEQQSPEDR